MGVSTLPTEKANYEHRHQPEGRSSIGLMQKTGEASLFPSYLAKNNIRLGGASQSFEHRIGLKLVSIPHLDHRDFSATNQV